MKIADKLREKLANIPELPGIYKMLDSRGNIIYIGKSISLKNRVKSYFTDSLKWSKVERMVALIHDFEYQVMDTHLEARLEECRLIKEVKPIFNAQFKNDRKYVYLKVENYNIYNPLSIVYDREDNCFGPIRSMTYVVEIINSFKNIYPIIKNKDEYEFDYNLIPISMGKDVFNVNKNSLEEILTNDINFTLFLNKLEEKMKEASSLLKFEKAGYYKNMFNYLNYLKDRLINNESYYFGNILLKIPMQNGYKLFFINNGEVILKENYINLTNIMIKDFIKRARVMTSSIIEHSNEKISMDFKDILFSEIKTMPEEMVLYIEE